MAKFSNKTMCEHCGFKAVMTTSVIKIDKVYEWDVLHREFGLSKTLKIHIMQDHIKDYVDLTNKPLGRRTDQTIEAAHQFMNKRMVRSQYVVKDIESAAHGLKLYCCVLHINSYNI